MNRPRVALLTTYIAPYRVSLFEELQKRLGELRIFISTKMEPNRRWEVDWGDLDVVVQKTITIPRKWKHPHGFIETTYMQIPYDTIFCLMAYKPQVVITAEMGSRTFFSAIYKVINPECKLVIWATISDVTEESRSNFRVMIRKLLLKISDLIITNGSSGQKYLNRLGIQNQKICLIPYTTSKNGSIYSSHFRKDDEIYRLLYVGQLIERKGIIRFIESINNWSTNNPDINIELWVVGSGDLYNNLQNYPKNRNLTVKLFGEVPNEELDKIFLQCGALIFPTLADEWGVVVNEAMNFGLIVLGSTYSQAVEEMVVEGESGFIFDPTRSEDIDKLLSNFFSLNPERLEEMRKFAIEKSNEYSPDLVGYKLAEAINNAFHKK